MPENTVYVGRPSRWGNPFPWVGEWATWAALTVGERADREGRVAAAVKHFREWLNSGREKDQIAVEYRSGLAFGKDEQFVSGGTIRVPPPPTIAEIQSALSGKNLACFCALDQPCHADVLLELANK